LNKILMDYNTLDNRVTRSRQRTPILGYSFLSKYTIPFALFSFWFFISPFLLPHRALQFSFVLRIGLLGFFLISIFRDRRHPSFGMLIWVMLFGFLSDGVSGNISASPASLIGYFLGVFKSNIGLLILMILYLRSWPSFENSLKAIVILITATISIVGFYQLYSGNIIADFSSIEQFVALFSFERNRLFGLLYPSNNQSAIILLIPLGLLLASMITRFNKFDFLLFTINFIALLLTFSRAAYVAFAVMYILALVMFSSRNRIMFRFLAKWSIILAVFLIPFVLWAQSYLERTGGIDRIWSLGTLHARLRLWEAAITFSTNLFFGSGLLADLQKLNFQIAGVYMTPHNFFFGWTMRFGWIPGLILLVIVGIQFKRMIKLSFDQTLAPGYHKICAGITLAFFRSFLGHH